MIYIGAIIKKKSWLNTKYHSDTILTQLVYTKKDLFDSQKETKSKSINISKAYLLILANTS